MKIIVNGALCSGHGRCYDVGALLFTSDDDGFCAERDTTFAVPAGLEASAAVAAASCPEGAIVATGDAS